MAYESNDLKGIFILVLFAIPVIASMNINCSGKAFHCVNSTHFMICVDLGGGLSTTIDDFILPCPATTVCHEHNSFECDFPKIEVAPPPLQVIGVYKQSDTSELPLVTNSVTAPTPTRETLSVLEKNITATTLPIPEDVTSVMKLEVLEDIQKPTGVKSESSTETSFQVTSSFIDKTNEIVNDVQTNNNTITTSAIDSNNNLVSTVNNSIDKAITTSLMDKSKSIDTVTSVIGLINLISTNPQSVVNTKPSSDVLSSLDTFYENIITTTEQYITREVTTHDKVENVTEELTIPTGTIFSDRSVIKEFSTTPVLNTLIGNDINTKIEDINKTYLDNQNIAKHNLFGKSSSTIELVPETTTEYVAVNITEHVTVDVSNQITTDETFVPLGLIDVISTDLIKSVTSTKLSSDYLNNLYDTTATTIDQYTPKQETKLSDKSVPTEKISTTPVLNTYHQSFFEYSIDNHSFTELNFTGEITTIQTVPETNINYFISEPMTVKSLQTTTGKNFVPIITEENIIYTTETTETSRNLINNDSMSNKIIAQPLEIIITTDSPIELTDNLYQMNRELNQSLISTKNNTADTMNTTERVKTNNISSTDVINDKGTYSTLSPSTTIKYPAPERLTTETLQKEFTAHAIEVKTELPATNVSTSVYANELFMDVKNDTLLSIYTTAVPYDVTSIPLTETIVKKFIAQSDNVTGITLDIIALNTSEGYTSIINGTTQKVITNPKNKITDSLDQPEIVTPQENLSVDQWTKSVQNLAGNTMINWNIFENSATTPFARDGTEETSFTESVKSINQENQTGLNVVITPDVLPKTILSQTPLSMHYVTEHTSNTPKTVYTTPRSVDSIKIFEQVSTNAPEIADIIRVSTPDFKIETSTEFAVKVTHFTNVEEHRDFAIKTTPPLELTSQKMDTLNQMNTISTATATVSDSVTSAVPTAGYILHNTKDKDLNTSNWKGLVNKENIIPKVDINANKTETVNLITGKNSHSITSLSTANINKDERIKTVSVFDNVNTSVNSMPNGTLQMWSSNPPISNDYIRTTKPQDFSVYVTTTDYIPGYKFQQVGELVTRNFEDMTKNPEAIVSLPDKKVMNSVLFTPSTYTLPILDIITENVKYVIGTEAPLPSTIDLEHIISTKTEVFHVTENTDDYFFPKGAVLTQLNKLSHVEPESSVSSDSGFTPNTAVAPDGLRAVPLYGEGTTIKADAFMMSSTQIMPQAVTDGNIKMSRDSLRLSSKVIGTQTVKYDNTDASLPISGVPASQMTTEPTHTMNLFARTTFTAIGKLNKDVLPGIKTTDLPPYEMSKANNNNSQSMSDITTKTFINSLTKSDAMVENIKIVGDKTRESYFEETVLTDVMPNKPIANNSNYNVNSVKNIIDHENIAQNTTEPTSKNIAQNTTVTSTNLVDINKAEIVNDTENVWLQSEINIDSDKIENSVGQELIPNSSVSKLKINLQNKFDTPIISKIGPKDGKTVDIIEYELPTVTKNPSYVIETESAAPKNVTQIKKITTKDNKNAEIDNSVNANIKIFDVLKYQARANLKNINNNYNISKIKTNFTTSYRNFSIDNSTLNDELAQHLISTNHTITTEVQSHLDENDKQSNKTIDGLILNGTNIHNLNLTNKKLNVESNDKNVITGAASFFNCSNHIRGKYADKKDCRKFYTCIGNLQPMIGTCPNNTVFSEINKQCTRNLSHCVRNNQFRCLVEGRFSDFFKDNIYYICVKNSTNTFIRYKLQCVDNYHLNKVLVKCEKNEEVSTQSASSVSETNIDESKPKIKSEKIVSTDFECEDEGKFPYAKDCTKYYICTKVKNVYRRKIKKCADDEVFDRKKKKCVDPDSAECNCFNIS